MDAEEPMIDQMYINRKGRKSPAEYKEDIPQLVTNIESNFKLAKTIPDDVFQHYRLSNVKNEKRFSMIQNRSKTPRFE